MKIGANEKYLFQNTKTAKFHEITFSKYCSFDSHGDVINPKLARRKIKINSKRNKFSGFGKMMEDQIRNRSFHK